MILKIEFSYTPVTDTDLDNNQIKELLAEQMDHKVYIWDDGDTPLKVEVDVLMWE